jgi:hypothetical protein
MPDGVSTNGKSFSGALFRDCKRQEIINNYGCGSVYRTDFLEKFTLTGDWTLTDIGSASPTFAVVDGRGGLVDLDAVSSTQHKGGQIQRASTVGEAYAPLANTKIWFEARILLKDIATVPNFFVGLHDIDTSILSSGAMVDASNDWIGFKCETALTTLLGTCSNNTTESVTGTLLTLSSLYDGDVTTDGTAWLKLGFRVTGTGLIEFYLQGVKVGQITSNIPTALMVPTFVLETDGTVDPIMRIDSVEIFVDDRTTF